MRVTLKESESMESSLKGIRLLKLNPGDVARILFVADEENELISYASPTHQVNLGKIKGRQKCVKDYFGPNGEPEIDPVTGKVKNDGTCPYCELGKTLNKRVNFEIEKWKEENPGASEKDQKAAIKKIFAEYQAIQQPEILRGFIVALLETDASGNKPVKDDKGNCKYELRFLQMSPNQYSAKFKPAITQYETHAWMELIFTNGNKEQDKMAAAKELTMNPVVKALITDGLKESILADIKKLDLSNIDNKIFGFRAESIEEIDRKLAAVQSRALEGLTDDEKKALAAEIEGSFVQAEIVNGDDVDNLFSSDSENEPESESLSEGFQV